MIWEFSKGKEYSKSWETPHLVGDMPDDEVDEELIALLRQSLGLHTNGFPRPAETRVLQDAEYIYNNSIDVALDSRGCKAAASKIWTLMQERKYSFSTWSEHDLHPKSKDVTAVDFIFAMDLLNFSFWSDKPTSDEIFAIDFRGKSWTGYWSLVAALQRALEEGKCFLPSVTRPVSHEI